VAKKVKRVFLTDVKDIPLSVTVNGANRQDNKLVKRTLDAIILERPSPYERIQNMCMDKGYYSPDIRDLVKEYGYTVHVKSRGKENIRIKIPGFRARRWVVERAHSWLNRFRRLIIRWEKKIENYLAMLHLECAWIIF
jgi:transposase